LIKARENASPDTIFVFCGDGVSDISAAKESDLLFARNGKDLVTYCTRQNIPFIGFDSFNEIHLVVKDLVDGKSRLEKDPATGFSKVVPNP
jgi:2-hydroxy-3-keto-5-methylthiopentenyl-1-phosphate phosphatase